MEHIAVIGAGPGGLTAATYLGRFRRAVTVIDGGPSRAQWIPESHNIPGFPQGVGGPRFLRLLREQAQDYGARFLTGRADTLTVTPGGFAIRGLDHIVEARFVVMATGTLDRLPPLHNAAAAVRSGLLRICPICDAYEAIGKSIAVIADGEHGAMQAEFLRTYSDRVALLQLGDSDMPRAAQLRAGGIRVIQVASSALRLRDDALTLSTRSGHLETFDVAYAALGCQPQNQLATALGAKCDGSGALQVGAHQETSVSGLYAIGDVVRGLNQVVVAAAEAAIAATDIHNRLRHAAYEQQEHADRDRMNHGE